MRSSLTTFGHLAIIVANAVTVGRIVSQGLDRPYAVWSVVACSAVVILCGLFSVLDTINAERELKESRDGEKQMAALAIKAMTERDACRSQLRDFERVTGMKYDDLPEDVI
jgi:uncharacterized membrane protein YjgN (DUF898 family)